MDNSKLTKINYISSVPVKFGNVTSAIDDNFSGIESSIESLTNKIPSKISDFSDAGLYATKDFCSKEITSKLSLGGYVTSVDLSVTKQNLTFKIQEQTNLVNSIKTDLNTTKTNVNTLNRNLNALSQHVENISEKYNPSLEDSVRVTHAVGGIKSTTTVSELKDKSLGDILTMMLFEETWPEVPTLNARITSPENGSVYFTTDDIPEVEITYNSSFDGKVDKNITKPQNLSNKVAREAAYTYNVEVIQQPIDITLISSNNHSKTESIPGNTYNLTTSIYITNPIEILDARPEPIKKKQRYGTTLVYTLDLQASDSKSIIIKIPKTSRTRLQLKKFNLNYLDVNWEVWQQTEDENYKYWEYIGTDRSVGNYQLIITF